MRNARGGAAGRGQEVAGEAEGGRRAGRRAVGRRGPWSEEAVGWGEGQVALAGGSWPPALPGAATLFQRLPTLGAPRIPKNQASPLRDLLGSRRGA